MGAFELFSSYTYNTFFLNQLKEILIDRQIIQRDTISNRVLLCKDGCYLPNSIHHLRKEPNIQQIFLYHIHMLYRVHLDSVLPNILLLLMFQCELSLWRITKEIYIYNYFNFIQLLFGVLCAQCLCNKHSRLLYNISRNMIYYSIIQ